MILPSRHGDQPTRGGPGANGPPMPRIGGLILATAAFPAATSFDHSIFCSDAMVIRRQPEILHHLPGDFSLLLFGGDVAAAARLPAARWKSPAAEGMPISVVTFDPPPDWP